MSTEQPSQPAKKSSTGLDENIAGLLCYVMGWVTGIIFLVIEKDSKTVKFHAWQSIFVFGGLSVLSIVLSFIPVIRMLGFFIPVIGLIIWVLLIYKTYSGEMFKLPVIGEMAEKQANK
jgi:uncharacterized membrane protein